jgi:hypothetical protein
MRGESKGVKGQRGVSVAARRAQQSVVDEMLSYIRTVVEPAGYLLRDRYTGRAFFCAQLVHELKAGRWVRGPQHWQAFMMARGAANA